MLGSPAERVDSGLSGIMDMLIDISSQLQATEHFIEEVKSDRAAEAAQRQETLSCSQPAAIDLLLETLSGR